MSGQRPPLGASVRGFAALVIVQELRRGDALERSLSRLAQGGVDPRLIAQARAAFEDLKDAAEQYRLWHEGWAEPTNQPSLSQPLEASVYMTTSEAGEALGGVSGEWVRRLVQSGRLAGHKVGRVWMVERASVDVWKARRAA